VLDQLGVRPGDKITVEFVGPGRMEGKLGEKPMAPAKAAAGGLSACGSDSPLAEWIARQHGISACAMLRSISAVDLVKERRSFGQTVRPARGSILASTAIGSWDPDPDYFFHWLRDSALVIDALRRLVIDGTHTEEGLVHCKDFVAFSHTLNGLDGGGFLRAAGDFKKKRRSLFSPICARR
jgi:glucoamylase